MLLVPVVLSAPPAAPGTTAAVMLLAGPLAGAGVQQGADSDRIGVSLDADVGVQAQSDGPATEFTVDQEVAAAGSGPAGGTATTRSTSTARAAAPATTTAAVAAPATAHAVLAKVAAPIKVAAAAAPAPPPTAVPTPPPTTAPPAPPSAADLVWNRLAVCESGNTNDGGAPYYGYWQFSAGTWHSVGEPGLPSDFSRERQLAAAKRLQAAQGWTPWPDCSRRLGLR
ncbi:MAG: transglycosylase family protein [Acidimicrobiales bacterium]